MKKRRRYTFLIGYGSLECEHRARVSVCSMHLSGAIRQVFQNEPDVTRIIQFLEEGSMA